MPLQIREDSLLVLKYERDGMVPGIIPLKSWKMPTLLNSWAIWSSGPPQVEEWSLPPASALEGVNDSIIEKPLQAHQRDENRRAYPILPGSKYGSFGIQAQLEDPVGISNINLFLAVSLEFTGLEQKFHAMLEWNFWNWRLKANTTYAFLRYIRTHQA